MILEKVLGKEHPDLASSLNNLASLYESMADYAKAEPLFEEGLAVVRKYLEATAAIQTERQQMVMDQSLRSRLDSYLDMSCAASRVPKNAVENALLWKGSVMRRLRGLRQAADDPAIAEQFSKLQSVAGQLSKVAQQTPAPEQAAAWRERLAALTSEREALEKQMVRDSAAFAQAVKPIGLADIQQAIPSDGVLIDYLEFNGKNDRQLLASIVKHDAEPTMVLLGKVSDLQTHVDAWRKSFVEEEHVDAKVGAAAGLAIRQQVWEPLLAHIGDAKTVLVSTDGVLGRLPLGALPGKQLDTYLIEDHRLVLLPVPQLLPLLMEKPADRQMLREMLLIGDVDYRANPQSTKPANDPEPAPRKRPWERSEGIDKVRGAHQWDPLVETGREVEFIGGMYRRLFKPSATALVDLRKAQATETAFREQAPGSTYLHVATHGFFATADKQSAMSGELIAKRGQDQNMFGENRDVLRGYSPGQLSGLVFAGANRKNEPLTPDPSPRSGARGDRDREDDGILTADEIAYLRLEGTRLVVLSACETGLGEVAGGEGLIGIQRGFQLAGARSTVSSLWKVNDAATRRLMEEFYTNFLEREMSMLDALREAQLWALRHPNDVPRGATIDLPNAKVLAPEQKRLSPRYWAAFVLSGDWR